MNTHQTPTERPIDILLGAIKSMDEDRDDIRAVNKWCEEILKESDLWPREMPTTVDGLLSEVDICLHEMPGRTTKEIEAKNKAQDALNSWCIETLENDNAMPARMLEECEASEFVDYLSDLNVVAAESYIDEVLMRIPAHLRAYIKNKA